MSRNGWFETVAEAQRRAKRRLPSSVYSALLAGSEKGITCDDNTAAFSELGLAPHVAGMHATRDLTTSVMGQVLSLPVIISPTGVQAVHPDGEIAVARAAASRGTVMGLSSFASKPVEEVVSANPRTFFQLYWSGTRETMVRRMNRARGGSQGPHRYSRLVVFERARLGQPGDPRTDEPEGHVQTPAPGDHPPAMAPELRKDSPHPRPDHAEPGGARAGCPDLLQRIQPMDADTARYME